MTIRRDYTNGQGYICPTENTAVHNLDKPSERPVAVKSYSGAGRPARYYKDDKTAVLEKR